jgi:serine/threonine-protein kinase
MLANPTQAADLFVAAVLALFSVALLLGRRRRASLLLSAFLLLVALNFLADGMGPDWSHITTDPWYILGFLTVAFDPPVLLAFALSYPYPRHGRAGLAAVAASLALAGAASVLRFTAPETLDFGLFRQSLGVAAMAVNLLACYLGAWLVMVRAARDAPTPLLARHAAWAASAIGIGVLPRLGVVLLYELGVGAWALDALGAARVGFGIFPSLAASAVILAAAAAGYAAGLLAARPFPLRPPLRAAFRLVATLVAGLLAVHAILLALSATTAAYMGPNLVFAARWVVFAGVLASGLLAYEVLEFQRPVERLLVGVGAACGAAAAGIAAAFALLPRGAGAALGFGALAAVAAALPAGVLARRGIVRLHRQHGIPEHVERRLELYRAATEATWAAGEPGPRSRRRLDRERRSFGVSPAEALVVEHMVRARLADAGPALRPGEEAAPGLVLGRLVGEGAHGRAFLASAPDGGRLLAKEFPAASAGGALRREWQALRHLRHPLVPALRGLHVVRGRLVLVRDWVEGATLEERLRRGPLPAAQVRALLDDVLDALEASHAAGVLHLDVKPSNLVLGRDGRGHLVDFSVAQVADDEQARDPGKTLHLAAGSAAAAATAAARPGGGWGAWAYLAPERAAGAPGTPASDLYSLAVVAVEALTGRPASEARAAALRLPAPWRAAVQDALRDDPRARPASAAAMRSRLPPAPAGPDRAAARWLRPTA